MGFPYFCSLIKKNTHWFCAAITQNYALISVNFNEAMEIDYDFMCFFFLFFLQLCNKCETSEDCLGVFFFLNSEQNKNNSQIAYWSIISLYEVNAILQKKNRIK